MHRCPHRLCNCACIRLPEAGCSALEIMSVTGRQNLAEVGGVNKKKLADSAIAKAYGA